MCALGCWWGEKITVLQVFLSQRNDIFHGMTSEPAGFSLLLPCCCRLTNTFFELAVRSYADLMWLSHLHVNIWSSILIILFVISRLLFFFWSSCYINVNPFTTSNKSETLTLCRSHSTLDSWITSPNQNKFCISPMFAWWWYSLCRKTTFNMKVKDEWKQQEKKVRKDRTTHEWREVSPVHWERRTIRTQTCR